jgi:hypothetical protein
MLIAIFALNFAVSTLAFGQTVPLFSVREAPALRMPGVVHVPNEDWGVDGNSPAVRDADGNLILFNSLSFPWRSTGPDLFNMNRSEPVTVNNRDEIEGGLWLEALYRDADGTLFGWFHNEFTTGCEIMSLGAPRIRQMVSRDDGKTWDDLGIVIAAPDEYFNCDTGNMYFTGLDPTGKVTNWHQGGWSQPAVGGKLSPILPPKVSWHESNLDAFWGPAIHYNVYLDQYVMLLNHAIGASWATEGFYISFNPDIENPEGWSTPQRLPVEPDSPLQAYPQIFGIEEDGTDRLARQVGRLFLQGLSKYEIVFWQPLVKPERRNGSSDDRLPPPSRTTGTGIRTRQ